MTRHAPHTPHRNRYPSHEPATPRRIHQPSLDLGYGTPQSPQDPLRYPTSGNRGRHRTASGMSEVGLMNSAEKHFKYDINDRQRLVHSSEDDYISQHHRVDSLSYLPENRYGRPYHGDIDRMAPHLRTPAGSASEWSRRQTLPKRGVTRKVTLVEGRNFVCEYAVPTAIQSAVEGKYLQGTSFFAFFQT